MTQPRRISLACLSLLLIASLAGAEGEPLRYRFKEGEKLRYVTEVKTTVELQGLGEPEKFDTVQVCEATWEVTKVDKDGRAAVTATMDRLRLTLDSPIFGKMEYDTKGGKEPDEEFFKRMAGTLKALAGGQVMLTIDPQGQVSDINLSDQVTKVVNGRPGPNADALSHDLLRGLTGELLPLPKGETKKGESWRSKCELTSPLGKVAVESKFTDEGSAERGGRRVQKVSIKETGTIDPKTVPEGEKATLGDSVGTASFDRTAGRLLERKETETLETERKLGDKTVTKKFKIVRTMKLLESEKP
ncbi:MAG TPA: hypothetical protein VKA46_19210 [Gemmataceae bacterium]|nr:hypothetical protein [Gemmataceae bacterium]